MWKAYERSWHYMDDLLDGEHRLKTRAVIIGYLAINLAITALYCYQITPQWWF